MRQAIHKKKINPSKRAETAGLSKCSQTVWYIPRRKKTHCWSKMTGHPQTMPVVDDHRILSTVKNNFHFVIWSMWNYLCDAHERMFPVSLRHVRSLMNCVEITFICIRRCFEKWGTAYCKSKPALFVFRSGSKLFCTDFSSLELHFTLLIKD